MAIDFTKTLTESGLRAERMSGRGSCPNRARRGQANGRCRVPDAHARCWPYLEKKYAQQLGQRPGFLSNHVGHRYNITTRQARNILDGGRQMPPGRPPRKLLARLERALRKAMELYGLLYGRLGRLHARDLRRNFWDRWLLAKEHGLRFVCPWLPRPDVPEPETYEGARPRYAGLTEGERLLHLYELKLRQ